MAKVTEVQQVNDALRSMVDKLVEYDNEVISDLLRKFGDALPKKVSEAPTIDDIDEYSYRTLTVSK